MKIKSVITTLLLAFVVVSIAFLFVKETTDQQKEKTPTTSTADTQGPLHKVIVYYFYTNTRCPSCRKIEAYTTEAVETGFTELVKTAAIELQLVNTDQPGNSHFINDYRLYTKSVVVADTVNGKQTRWKNLENVWKLLGDKSAFIKYVRDEVKSYLQDES